jgi:Caspase domain
MAHTDHYAILLGINHYPGLRDLGGPENDIAAFEQWLEDPAGGDVARANIKVIRSSDYAPHSTNPNDANPTERAFIKALDGWVRIDRTNWRDQVGTRLYLYMAGHGFTAGASINDPALFSAVAQSGDTAHIAGYRYASRLASAGFFAEIVLIMDCCQDVLKASQVLDPTWQPPDRNQSGAVKLLQAYGAPRGEAAFESEESPGVKRGYFSRVLLDALRAALPDGNGFVTGTTLKNQFLQIWGDRYRATTGYDPPLITPAGQDIQLFPRSAAVIGPANIPPVNFSLKAPVAAGTILTVEQRAGVSLLNMDAGSLTAAWLPPGIYKATLQGTGRAALFEVDGAGITRVAL